MRQSEDNQSTSTSEPGEVNDSHPKRSPWLRWWSIGILAGLVSVVSSFTLFGPVALEILAYFGYPLYVAPVPTLPVQDDYGTGMDAIFLVFFGAVVSLLVFPFIAWIIARVFGRSIDRLLVSLGDR